jgi:hypothetical protein
MSGNDKKKSPLVAERRYSRAETAPKKKAATKRTARRKTTATRKKRGPIAWLFAVIGGFFKLIWRLTWRLTSVMAIILGVGVY